MKLYSATLRSNRKVQLADLNTVDLFDMPMFKESVEFIKSQTVGLSNEDAQEVTVVFFGFALAYQDMDVAEVMPIVIKRIGELGQKEGNEWAGRYFAGLVNKNLRPAYDAAVAAGTDPVRSVAAQLIVLYPGKDMAAEEIEKVVALFRAEDEKAAKS